MSKPETEPKQTIPSSGAPKAEPNPFAPFTPWIRDHAARIEAIADEVAVFEQAMVKRIKTNAADVAALVQDTLDYVTQVGAEWRKIAIDTARRAADLTGRA
jgi:hypothetical protein